MMFDLDQDDARDLAIHRMIDGYVCLIMAAYGLARDEAILRMEAFAEAEREEEREQRAFVQACGAEGDA